MILHVKDPFHPKTLAEDENQKAPIALMPGTGHRSFPFDKSSLITAASKPADKAGSKSADEPISQSHHAGRAAARRSLRILVAEDIKATREAVLRYLDYLGYTADVATDGRSALAAMWHQPYDLVIMDIQMPDIDGVEATRRIRQDWPPGFQPQIVVMTAHALETNWKQLLDDGIIGCLIKPFTMDELAEVLDKCVRMKDAQ